MVEKKIIKKETTKNTSRYFFVCLLFCVAQDCMAITMYLSFIVLFNVDNFLSVVVKIKTQNKGEKQNSRKSVFCVKDFHALVCKENKIG